MFTRKQAEWLAVLLFVALIAVVFQQIATSMTEQGIASGSPYDNAAAYPKAVAIAIGILLAGQVVLLLFRPAADERLSWSDFRRGATLVAVFAAYLLGLDAVGYHIATPAMIVATMAFAGLRNPLVLIGFGVGVSLAAAYFFEVYLNVVLPGGAFGLNIPW